MGYLSSERRGRYIQRLNVTRQGYEVKYIKLKLRHLK